MKKLILTTILAVIANISFSQELTIDKVDEFTGSTIKLTKYYKVGKRGSNVLYMSLRRVDDTYGIAFWSTLDQGCAGSTGNYTILLDSDNQTIKFDNDIADIDCADNGISVYVLTLEDADTFEIAKIRFAQSKSYDDFEYTGEYTLQQLIEAVK